MGKQKKKGDKHTVEKLLIATALINLIREIINLLKALIT